MEEENEVEVNDKRPNKRARIGTRNKKSDFVYDDDLEKTSSPRQSRRSARNTSPRSNDTVEKKTSLRQRKVVSYKEPSGFDEESQIKQDKEDQPTRARASKLARSVKSDNGEARSNLGLRDRKRVNYQEASLEESTELIQDDSEELEEEEEVESPPPKKKSKNTKAKTSAKNKKKSKVYNKLAKAMIKCQYRNKMKAQKIPNQKKKTVKMRTRKTRKL